MGIHHIHHNSSQAPTSRWNCNWVVERREAIPEGAGTQNTEHRTQNTEPPHKSMLLWGADQKQQRETLLAAKDLWFKSVLSMRSSWLRPHLLLGKPLPRGTSDWNVNRTRSASLRSCSEIGCVDHGRSLTMYCNYIAVVFRCEATP